MKMANAYNGKELFKPEVQDGGVDKTMFLLQLQGEFFLPLPRSTGYHSTQFNPLSTGLLPLITRQLARDLLLHRGKKHGQARRSTSGAVLWETVFPTELGSSELCQRVKGTESGNIHYIKKSSCSV